MKKKLINSLLFILFGLLMGILLTPANTLATFTGDLVRTFDLAPKAVTSHKMAPNSVYTGKIADRAVQTTDIANDAITNPKIKDSTWYTLMSGWMQKRTQTIDLPSIAAQTCEEKSWTLFCNFKNGNGVIANPVPTTGGVDELDVTWNAFISDESTNEVTLRVCNPTAGALDPASQLWKLYIWQQ